jgi:AcrR family transcriptional regulator
MLRSPAPARRLRDDLRQVTRERILDAVLDLVSEGAMGELSVPQVARRSGVSVATIYRYFPTKDAMLDAAAETPVRRVSTAVRPGDLDEAADFLRAMWRDFTDNIALVRRQAASEAGREMRDRRLATSRAWFAEMLERRGVDPKTIEGERLLHVALLLTSSLAFLDLHDRQGLGADEAADHVTWAVTELIDSTRRAQPAPRRTKGKR